MSRIGGGGMKLRMSPCASRFAIRAVLHIGLPARHGLHVVRIGQDYLKAPFKEVEDRFPVYARRLHRHVCACRVRQPLVKPEQLGGRRAESSHLGLRPPALVQPEARRDRSL